MGYELAKYPCQAEIDSHHISSASSILKIDPEINIKQFAQDKHEVFPKKKLKISCNPS
jgi:hypothetical protein